MTFHITQSVWYWRGIQLFNVIRHRWRTILVAVVFGILAALVITAITPPVFTSRATIRVGDMDANGCVPNYMSWEEMARLMSNGTIRGTY